MGKTWQTIVTGISVFINGMISMQFSYVVLGIGDPSSQLRERLGFGREFYVIATAFAFFAILIFQYWNKGHRFLKIPLIILSLVNMLWVVLLSFMCFRFEPGPITVSSILFYLSPLLSVASVVGVIVGSKSV